MSNANNRTALVIGANGGIGFCATKKLLKDGYKVFCSYNRNKEKLDKILDTNSYGEQIEIFSLDARSSKDVGKKIDEILFSEKKIDTVVLTLSSEYKNIRLFQLSWEDYIAHHEVQVKSLFNVYKSLEDQIKSKVRTKIIVILSDVVFGSPPKGFSHYVTSKYALLGLSKSLASELSQYGLTINMVSPGIVETDLLKNMPSKLLEINAHQNPMKRNATAVDVADVISFLASENADYLNGVNITVNGGSNL